MASSWKNASLGYELFNNPVLMDKRGRPLILTDQNLQTKVFAAAGFHLSDLKDLYKASMNRRAANDRLNDKVSSILSVMAKRFPDSNMTEKDLQRYSMALQSLIDHKDPMAPEIKKRVLRAIRDGRTRDTRALKDYMMRSLRNITTPADVLHPYADIFQERKQE
jgi:hypothetical protein